MSHQQKRLNSKLTEQHPPKKEQTNLNLITTIPMREYKIWVKTLFKRGPHKGIPYKQGGYEELRKPDYPPRFPFARRVTRAKEIKFIYIVNNGHIIGYGKVGKHRHRKHDASVGLKPERVRPGDEFILKGPLSA